MMLQRRREMAAETGMEVEFIGSLFEKIIGLNIA